MYDDLDNTIFHGCTNLTELNLEKSYIKVLGPHCFADCKSLTYIYLPNTLTSICSYAFANTKISNLELPNSIEFLGKYCFNNTTLTSIIFPNNIKFLDKDFLYGSNISTVYYDTPSQDMLMHLKEYYAAQNIEFKPLDLEALLTIKTFKEANKTIKNNNFDKLTER